MSSRVARLAKQLEKLQQDDFEVCLFVCLLIYLVVGLFICLFVYHLGSRESVRSSQATQGMSDQH